MSSNHQRFVCSGNSSWYANGVTVAFKTPKMKHVILIGALGPFQKYKSDSLCQKGLEKNNESTTQCRFL